MSSPRTEGDVRKAIRAHINDLFPGAYVESNPPSPWGESGRPDIELCLPSLNEEDAGIYVGLELKNPDYAAYPWRGLNAEQEVKLRKIALAHGLALLTNNAPYKSEGLWHLAVWAYSVESKSTIHWVPALITGGEGTTFIASQLED